MPFAITQEQIRQKRSEEYRLGNLKPTEKFLEGISSGFLEDFGHRLFVRQIYCANIMREIITQESNSQQYETISPWLLGEIQSIQQYIDIVGSNQVSHLRRNQIRDSFVPFLRTFGITSEKIDLLREEEEGILHFTLEVDNTSNYGDIITYTTESAEIYIAASLGIVFLHFTGFSTHRM